MRLQRTDAIDNNGRARLFCKRLFLALAFTLPPRAIATDLGAGDREERATFAPGVRIDWTTAAVEIDSRIVLRKGPLELIACSPETREHESILVTKARPTHVFQAMGLVGLTPGSPVTYHEKDRTWTPPTGERLRISARCGKEREFASIRTWVVDPKTKTSPREIPWVFAGSSTLPDGRFLADLDGTVICLVDFESALITVGALHSADNTSLWLEANTNAIPPIGTSCTIRIESQTPRIIAVLGANGELTRKKRPVTAAIIAAELKTHRDRPAIVAILCDPGVSKSQSEAVRAELVAAGVSPARLSIRRATTPAKDGK